MEKFKAWQRPAGWIVFFFLYLAGGMYTLVRQLLALPFPLSVFMDFGFYQNALQRALSGGDMYAVRGIGEAYLYPPPALLLVDVLNILPDPVLRGAFFGALNLLLAAALVYGVARVFALSPGQVWYWYPLALGFAPLWVSIELGQINMVTQFGLVLLFVYETTLPGWAGFGLALAIMTKVTPLFFGAYLLAARNLKALLWTGAGLAGLALLAVLRYGIQPFITYPDVFHEMSGQIPVGSNGQSLAADLARVGLANPGLAQFGLTVYLLAVIVLAAYLGFRTRRKEPAFIVTALAMLLAPNILWYHHFVFFLLPLLAWMGWRRDSRAVTLWCLGGMLLIQFDYFLLSGGLLIHLFGHLSILTVVFQGARYRRRVLNEP